MTKEERARRDVQIALARLQGVPSREVAETFEVSVRTTQRVTKKWQVENGFGDGEPRGLDEVLAKVNRDRELSDARVATDAAALDQRVGGRVEDAVRRLRALRKDRLRVQASAASVMAGGGASRRAPHPDWIHGLTARLRVVLSEHDANPELIAELLDAVMDAYDEALEGVS